MEDFSARHGAEIGGGQRQNSDGAAFRAHELHLEGVCPRVKVDDRAHISGFKAVFGEITGQDDRIKFLDHAATSQTG